MGGQRKMEPSEIWNVVILFIQGDYLDVKFVFKLKSTVGYEYTETVDTQFSKMKNTPWYKITKYNMCFNR